MTGLQPDCRHEEVTMRRAPPAPQERAGASRSLFPCLLQLRGRSGQRPADARTFQPNTRLPRPQVPCKCCWRSVDSVRGAARSARGGQHPLAPPPPPARARSPSPAVSAFHPLPSPPCRRLVCLLGHLSPRDTPSTTAQQQRQQWQLPQQARALHSSGTLGSGMEDPAAAAAAADKARAKAAVAQAVHRSPSAKHLSQLTNILNARDLAEASPALKPGGRQAWSVLAGWMGLRACVAAAWRGGGARPACSVHVLLTSWKPLRTVS